MNRTSMEKVAYDSATDSDNDTLLEQEGIFPTIGRRRAPPCLLWFALGVIASAFVSILAFNIIVSQNKDGVCAAYSSRWSPIARDVDIKYSLTKYDGRFKEENIYRQKAGPEVDAAWEALGIDLRPIQMDEEDAIKAGMTHSHVRINKKYGGGYAVNVEGLHHLHCLNLLRQSTYFNYNYYKARGKGAFENDGQVLHWHVTHCLDTLRQQLMCTTDTGLLGRVWWNQSDPTPFVDFNTQHKCKNYDVILKWARDHQMTMDPETTPDDFLELPTEGDVVLTHLP